MYHFWGVSRAGRTACSKSPRRFPSNAGARPPPPSPQPGTGRRDTRGTFAILIFHIFYRKQNAWKSWKGAAPLFCRPFPDPPMRWRLLPLPNRLPVPSQHPQRGLRHSRGSLGVLLLLFQPGWHSCRVTEIQKWIANEKL